MIITTDERRARRRSSPSKGARGVGARPRKDRSCSAFSS
jgi:hypothetical protein